MTQDEFKAVEGNIKEQYDGYFDTVDPYIEPFYHMVTDETASMSFTTDGAMGMMSDWDGSVAYDDFNFGYEEEIRPDKKSTGIQIPIEMWTDKEYRKIKNVVNKVRHGVLKTLRYNSGIIFEGAFGTDITGPDSAGLCSASHHITPGDTAQSNTNTLALNYENLYTCQLAMRNFKDDRGHRMIIEGNHVIAGDSLAKTCMQMFKPEKESWSNGDNTPNYFRNMSYEIHPMITGNKWFLTNKELMAQGDGLNWWMRRDPRNIVRDMSIPSDGDFDTEWLKWKAVGRWKTFWINWWFIYGNNVA